MFAFCYSLGESSPVDGWNLYNAERDYTRLGLLGTKDYRLVTINKDFSLCPSYPPTFITPSSMTDEEIKTIASYRSQGRIPAVVWIHPLTKASLSRCAQPLAGLKGKRWLE